jgi:hypothetical protein
MLRLKRHLRALVQKNNVQVLPGPLGEDGKRVFVFKAKRPASDKPYEPNKQPHTE